MNARAQEIEKKCFKSGVTPKPAPELPLSDEHYAAWSEADPITRIERRIAICALAAKAAWQRGMDGWIRLVYGEKKLAWVNVDSHMGMEGGDEPPL